MRADAPDEAAASPTIGEPRTRDDIVAELRSLHLQSTEFWNRFSDDEFFSPLGTAWSPAENLRHLDLSIKPLTRALRLPISVLWLLFGPARTPSRDFVGVRETYLGRLATGFTAGRFTPPPTSPPRDAPSARAEMMARREERARALWDAIGSWHERSLDRCRLPHPALGKLTVREMLFFTLYHNLHHVKNVAVRLPDGPRS